MSRSRIRRARPVLWLAAIGAVLALGLSPSASGAATAFPADLKVMTHNVQFLPNPIGKNDTGRAQLISAASYWKGQDVVALEELFDVTASPILLNGLRGEYPYQTPIVGTAGTATGWNFTQGTPHATYTNGGVAIVSKHPIIEQGQFIYPAGCGTDQFAAKGFAYAAINRGGRKVHIIATHLQADDPTCYAAFKNPATVRASQLQAIAGFVARKAIPASEPVVITGDMNVAKGSSEFAAMLSTLKAAAPTSFTGAPYSMDGTTNSMAEDARVTLDYVLFERNHLRPLTWTNEVITPKSPPWSWGFTTYNDYSDHYPVKGLTV
jgi:sphingomyelin phosphodiesterase